MAATIFEPFFSFARDDLRVIGKPYDVYGKAFEFAPLFTSRDFASRNPDVLRRLSGAYYETARWANAHQADTLQILAKAAKLDIDRIQSINRWLWATSFGPRDLQPILIWRRSTRRSKSRSPRAIW